MLLTTISIISLTITVVTLLLVIVAFRENPKNCFFTAGLLSFINTAILIVRNEIEKSNTNSILAITATIIPMILGIVCWRMVYKIKEKELLSELSNIIYELREKLTSKEKEQ